MSALFILIPLALLALAVAVWAFVWAVNHEQFEELDQDLVNPKELDAATYARDTAKAALRVAEFQTRKAKLDVKTAEQAIRELEARESEVEVQLGEHVIVSPVAGVVTECCQDRSQLIVRHVVLGIRSNGVLSDREGVAPGSDLEPGRHGIGGEHDEEHDDEEHEEEDSARRAFMLLWKSTPPAINLSMRSRRVDLE